MEAKTEEETDPIAELAIQKWAENSGMDPQKARERYLPVLTKRNTVTTTKDKVVSGLIETCKLLERLEETKRSASEPTKRLLDSVGTGLVLGMNRREGESEETVDPTVKYITQMKLWADTLEKAWKKEGGDEERGTAVMDQVNVRIDKLEELITKKEKSEEIQALWTQITDLLNPIITDLKGLKAAKEGGKTFDSDTDLIIAAREKRDALAQELELDGYTKKGAEEKGLSPKEMIAELKEAGYLVGDGPLPRGEHLRIVEEEKEKARKEGVEEGYGDRTADIGERFLERLVELGFQFAPEYAPKIQRWFASLGEAASAGEEAPGGEGQPPGEGAE